MRVVLTRRRGGKGELEKLVLVRTRPDRVPALSLTLVRDVPGLDLESVGRRTLFSRSLSDSPRIDLNELGWIAMVIPLSSSNS